LNCSFSLDSCLMTNQCIDLERQKISSHFPLWSLIFSKSHRMLTLIHPDGTLPVSLQGSRTLALGFKRDHYRASQTAAFNLQLRSLSWRSS
jgi:hypothetical protein